MAFNSSIDPYQMLHIPNGTTDIRRIEEGFKRASLYSNPDHAGPAFQEYHEQLIEAYESLKDGTYTPPDTLEPKISKRLSLERLFEKGRLLLHKKRSATV